MEKFLSVVLVVFALMVVAVRAVQEITCEATLTFKWAYVDIEIPTCLFNSTTVVDSSDVLIKSDFAASGIYFQDNKKTAHLPIGISKTFPNLLILDATYCSIKRLRPENFEGLKNLKFLWMAGNLIDVIPRDTFKDLVSLTDIDLRKFYARNNIRKF